METKRTKPAGQRTSEDVPAPPKPGTLASMPLLRGTEEPAKEASSPDLAKLFSRSLEWVGSPLWGAPPKDPAKVLDETLSRLWVDLYDYEEKHPSIRARLARQLVIAAQQLLRDEQDETVRAAPAHTDGRTKLTHGVKVYLEARGKPAPDVRLEWSVGNAIQYLRHLIQEVGCILKEKNPGTSIEEDPAIRAACVSRFVSKLLWVHDDWSAFRAHLRQNRQPENAPNEQRLAREVEGIFRGRYSPSPTPPAPDTWPDLAARVLAAAVRVAGGDRRFADNILRSERGTPKGKQSGSVDRALLPPRRKRKG